MGPVERANKLRKKYPELLIPNSDRVVSLMSVVHHLQVYEYLAKIGQLQGSGLETFKEDLKWILLDTKEERKEKLNKIRQIYEDY
jgi:hypothetical protein